MESQKGADAEDTYTLGDGLVKADFKLKLINVVLGRDWSRFVNYAGF